MVILFHYTTVPGKHPHKFHILLHTSKTKDLKLPLKCDCQKNNTSPFLNLAFYYAHGSGLS